ncbi:uncharacterized protein ACA1_142020 [Acanthamoeba castellanii str. Neff]|jgi:hypothetical protein|uniref:Mitochondrial import inner membrane translocase subunit n=1 Tax=Acanthamoeba castellanii (strain ATCC 30010 / Neff) TaxID=1257118 RepID=L8HB87_ACACF|nr:uncharacterized protein ACA1_142020 [Acanthamoeba castellanii str. Neff]ELR22512.1 hypothetical protein ACA1_142020 [Acanthamoeba castellanii str. Neff]
MDDTTLRQRAAALQAEVMIQVSVLATTDDCWKVCMKGKTSFGTTLNKNEKECFHNCTMATVQSENFLTKRTAQHIEQQARQSGH